ncbi:penicillin-binding protein 2 [bacterium]|nr:penicillin-binding protein 2 [bacterium]
MARARPSADRFEHRLAIGVVLGIAFGALVVARLVHVQLVQSGRFRAQAVLQQERELPISASRGPILDRNDRPLALTVPADRRKDAEAYRIYPRGHLASQLLGFVSPDGRGQDGIERVLDGALRGTDGARVVAANAKGYLSTAPDSRTRPPENGASVRLTIDTSAQSVLERELERCVRESGAHSATAILMDPRTGDILAIGTYPSYDPSDPGASPMDTRRLRAVTDCAEPGSTFKVVAVAACLEDGLVEPGTLVESCEELELAGGHVLHDEEDFGWVSVEETLVLSVNTATAQLARKAGPDRLFEYARAFGFGCVTGVDLAGEVSGILRRPAHWSGRSLETIAIGQEVAVTPLQLACAYGAIANDGVMMRPRILDEVRDASGRRVRTERPRAIRRVVSRSTAQALRRMLARVVEEGTGGEAAIPGIAVAGKTGTAQWFDVERRRYDPRAHVSKFAGMVPAEDPVIVGAVVVDRPDGVGYGGRVAAPCFRRIVEGALLASPEPTVLAMATPIADETR